MADYNETTQLLYDIQLQGASAAYRNLERLEGQVDRATAALKRATDRKLSDFSGVADQVQELDSVVKDLVTSLNDAAQQEVGLAKQGKKAAAILIRENEAITASANRMSDAIVKGEVEVARAEMKAIKDREGLLREEIRKTNTLLARQRQLTSDIYEVRRSGKRGMAEHFYEQSFLEKGSSKDLLGMVEGGASVANRAGLFAQGKALEMSAAGGNKQMIAMLRTLGSSLTKVAALAGGFMIVGKLLFDSYSRAKELNAMFLEGSSLASTMGAEFMATPEGLAMANAELAKFRLMADDVFTYFKYDLSAENYGQFVNQLSEQGLRVMSAMRGDVTNVQKMLIDAQILSKNLGVDIGSVMQLQASYMETLGADMDQLHSAMVLLQDDALNSGMSTKRFYGIIAQATNEMGQYNLRLSETGHALRQISRAMNASDAEAFLKRFGQGFQDASVGDRLRIMALSGKGDAGKAGGPALQATLRSALAELSPAQQQALLSGLSKTTGKAVTLGGAGSALGKLDAKGLSQLGAALNDPQLYQQVIKIARIAQAAQQGGGVQGVLSQAQVGGDFGAMQQIVMQLGALRTVVGSERIYDSPNAVIRGAGAGYSEREVRQAQAFELQALTDLERLRKVAKEGGDVTAEAAKLGYGVSAGKGGQLLGAGGQEIKSVDDLLLSMQESTAERIRKQYEGQKSVAEKQIDATRNVADVLEKGVQYILTQIYDVISNIYEFLVDKLGSDEARAAARGARRVRTASQNVMAAQKAVAEAKTPEEAKAAQLRLDNARSQLQAVQKDVLSPVKETRLPAKVDGAYRMFSQSELSAARARGADVQTELSQGEKQLAASQSASLDQIPGLVGNTLGLDFLKQLKQSGGSPEQVLKVQTEMERLMRDKGIALSPESMTELARKMAEEYVKNWRAAGLAESAGISLEAAKALTSGAPMEGLGLTKEQTGKVRSYYERANMTLPSGGDAMLLSSGVPALNLKAGDMVIDRNSLAQVKYGAPGSMAGPAAAALAGVSGGSGGSVTVHVHVYNGDPAATERAVYQALDKYRRGRRYAGG